LDDALDLMLPAGLVRYVAVDLQYWRVWANQSPGLLQKRLRL